MVCKLKILGLTLAATVAIGAVAATAASATVFHSETEPTYLSGEQVVMNRLDTTNPLESSFICKKTGLSGEASKTAEALTLSATYKECTFLGLTVDWSMNGCDYRFTATGANPNYDGIVHIECPEFPVPKNIELVVRWAGKVTCTIDIPSQTGLVDYTNQGSGKTRDMLVTWTFTNLVYTVTHLDTPEATGSCGKQGTFNDGKLTGSITLKGFSNVALTEQTGIWVE